jgi:hypothetical protein
MPEPGVTVIHDAAGATPTDQKRVVLATVDWIWIAWAGGVAPAPAAIVNDKAEVDTSKSVENGCIDIWYAVVPGTPAASVTFTEKEELPPIDGMPLIVPPVLRLRPVGRLPEPIWKT